MAGAEGMPGRGQGHVDGFGDQYGGIAFGAECGQSLVVGPRSLGPPVKYPIQVRISGRDTDELFTIAANGMVQSASVTETTLKNSEVERCITAKIRTWKFPKPKGGGIVIVKYPFIFKTSG